MHIAKPKINVFGFYFGSPIAKVRYCVDYMLEFDSSAYQSKVKECALVVQVTIYSSYVLMTYVRICFTGVCCKLKSSSNEDQHRPIREKYNPQIARD